MQILSHRGYWKTAAEKNTATAFGRSFQLGFGTETDLRDLAGRVVVSHDPPLADALSADVLFGIYREAGAIAPLALNIKADGLQKLLPPLLDAYAITNYFVFDMSVPDALGWLRVGAPAFTRHSDEEQHPVFYDRATGVWLDGFRSDWWDEAIVAGHLNAGKRVCIVSPDLHGRDPRPVWTGLAGACFRDDSRVMICTDRPEEAAAILCPGNAGP
jgi:hypothetical protein